MALKGRARVVKKVSLGIVERAFVKKSDFQHGWKGCGKKVSFIMAVGERG
jgi:hypothetical protein